MSTRFTLVGTILVLAGLGSHPEMSWAELEAPALTTQATLLTIEEAVARALRCNPELTAASEELRAVEAEYRQAGRLPNPELAVTLENVAGDGGYRDTDAAELTIELSQPIELGGKRWLRQEAAALGLQLATHGQTLANAEILATARQRFIAVLAAQEGLALVKEQAELAEKSLAAAEERIKAGKSPTIDRLRLQAEVSLARLTVSQAERALEAARQDLAASWGEKAWPDFDRVAGDLTILPIAPDLSAIEATLEQTPAAANRRIATELQRVEMEQAKARRIPDPSLTVGWRQFEESNEDAWLFGISFPLPLFNQGQDAVAAASSRFNSVKAREIGVRNQVRSTLRTTWQALADARAAAEVFANQVVPAAAEGFAAAEYGYRAGKFGLLELLDAQRALFEARQRQLTAQTASHLAAIELQRLQGSEAGAVIP